MFNPLGAVSALGSGAMSGLETGMDLSQKYDQLQGQQLLMGALKGINGMSPAFTTPDGGSGPPPPLQGAQAPPQAAPGPPMPPQGPIQQPPMSGGQSANISPVSMAQAGPMSGGAGPRGPGYPGMMSPQPMVNPGPNVPATGGFQPPPRPQAPPVPPASPEAQERIQGGQATPYQMQQFMTKGIGWMSVQELATRIEQANPNASAGAKFQALKMGAQLLNQSGQTQFNQMMQMAQFQQRERQHEDTLRHQRTMEELAQSREGRMSPEGQASKAAAVAPVQAIKSALTDRTKQLSSIESQTQNMLGNMDRLIDLSKEVSITGVVPIDTWLTNIRQKFGDSVAGTYKAQLEMTRIDVARVLNNPTSNAALTEGARTEVQHYMGGTMSPKTLTALKELYKVDGKIRRKSLEDEIRSLQDRLKTGGQMPEEQPEAPVAAAPAGGSAGWGKAQVVQ